MEIHNLIIVLKIVFDNNWLSIADLLNTEITCLMLAYKIRIECRLKEIKVLGTESYTPYEEQVITSQMAKSIKVDDHFIRFMVEECFLNQCFVGGSTLVTAILGKQPFSDSNLNLYVPYIMDDADDENNSSQTRETRTFNERLILLSKRFEELGFFIPKILGFSDIHWEIDQLQYAYDTQADIFNNPTPDIQENNGSIDSLLSIISFRRQTPFGSDLRSKLRRYLT